MSAERLRQAAAKVRETARNANGGGEVPEWRPYDWKPYEDATEDTTHVFFRNGNAMAQVADCDWPGDATHIALWSPPVALAVANWLDNEAFAAPFTGAAAPALALADLILGETQP